MSQMIRTTLHVTIVLEEGGGAGYVYAMMRKGIRIPFCPPVGMEIEDSAWHEPRPVQQVSFAPEQQSLYLPLGTDKMKTKEQAQRRVEMYEAHGWTKVGKEAG